MLNAESAGAKAGRARKKDVVRRLGSRQLQQRSGLSPKAFRRSIGFSGEGRAGR